MRLAQIIILSILPWAVFVFSTAEAWPNKSRLEDSEHFYYLGISSPASDKRGAFEEAYWMAIRALISEHFGVELNLHEQFFGDSSQMQMNQQIQVAGTNVRLQGVRVVKEAWEKAGERFIGRLQIAYSKAELAKERKRQEIAPKTGPAKMNRHQAEGKGRQVAELLVTSEPGGADVILNSEMIGKTKLFSTQLAEGVFDLEIRKENYETYKTKVILLGSETTKIDVKLKRAKSDVEFSTLPKNARIDVECDEFVKSKVARRLRLPAGRCLAHISHSGYVTKTESFVVSAGRSSFFQFSLEAKEKEKGAFTLRPIDDKVSVNIRTNSSPLTLVFFNPEWHTTYKNVTDNKTLRVDSRYALVQATDSMGRELFAELIRDGDRIRPLIFDFNHYKNMLRPTGGQFFEVQVYSDLYPARIQFFDPKKIGRFEEVKWQGATISLRQPFLFYRAFGPNGEVNYGYVDYRLTPWRVVLRFRSAEATKRIQSIESLKLFAIILGAVALGVGAVVIGVKTEPKY
jgi:3'-phosphoadenosine 5'-phosphosulfate sulfotransferase